MSADNGIYILKTPDENHGYRYRVIHAQAIDNIWYPGPEENPEEVVSYFGRATPVSQQEARNHAFDLAAQQDILEYGISEIELSHPFEYYECKSKQKGVPADKSIGETGANPNL